MCSTYRDVHGMSQLALLSALWWAASWQLGWCSGWLQGSSRNSNWIRRWPTPMAGSALLRLHVEKLQLNANAPLVRKPYAMRRLMSVGR